MPTITASILNIRLRANPARNLISPPESVVNNVGATPQYYLMKIVADFIVIIVLSR